MIWILACDAAASDHYRRAHRLPVDRARYVAFAEDLHQEASFDDELKVLVGASPRRDYGECLAMARALNIRVTFP